MTSIGCSCSKPVEPALKRGPLVHHLASCARVAILPSVRRGYSWPAAATLSRIRPGDRRIRRTQPPREWPGGDGPDASLLTHVPAMANGLPQPTRTQTGDGLLHVPRYHTCVPSRPSRRAVACRYCSQNAAWAGVSPAEDNKSGPKSASGSILATPCPAQYIPPVIAIRLFGVRSWNVTGVTYAHPAASALGNTLPGNPPSPRASTGRPTRPSFPR